MAERSPLIYWLVLTGLTFGLILLGMAMFKGEALALALPLAVYWLAGLVAARGTLQLRVDRQVSAAQAECGVPITVRLTLTNLGDPLEQVEIEDNLPPSVEVTSGQSRRLLTALARGSSAALTYTVRCRHGLYQFDGVNVTVSDYLGLAPRALTLSAPAEVAVHPEVVRLPRLGLRPRHTGVYAGLIATRQGGTGLTFFGVREYQAGDNLRHINWRASARHAESLFTNKFQQERATDIGVILDVRRRSQALTSAAEYFEQSVMATASLAESFLVDGNRVGVMLYGRYLLDWTFPGYGRPQRERILQALTRARLGAQHAFDRLEYLPTRFFIPGSQIVFISPLMKEDVPVLVQLRARGYAVLVVSADPVAFEARQLGGRAQAGAVELAARIARLERRLLLEQLQQAGVRVLDWEVAVPFEQAVRGYARRTRSWA
jgi:uncharacterized protein (DUF58 family)